MAQRINWVRLKLSKYKIKYLQFLDLVDQRRRVDFAFIHVPKCGGTSISQSVGQRIKNHDTARERRDKLGADRWNQIYSFSITRHPYERAISFHNFSKKTMYAKQQIGDLELNDWVRATLRDQLLSERVRTRLLLPCRDWLIDETGQIIVDEIFPLETLSEYWPEIECRTGVASQLSHVNSSGSGMTRDLLDATSKKILQDHFRADFETFDYAP